MGFLLRTAPDPHGMGASGIPGDLGRRRQISASARHRDSLIAESTSRKLPCSVTASRQDEPRAVALGTRRRALEPSGRASSGQATAAIAIAAPAAIARWWLR